MSSRAVYDGGRHIILVTVDIIIYSVSNRPCIEIWQISKIYGMLGENSPNFQKT